MGPCEEADVRRGVSGRILNPILTSKTSVAAAQPRQACSGHTSVNSTISSRICLQNGIANHFDLAIPFRNA